MSHRWPVLRGRAIAFVRRDVFSRAAFSDPTAAIFAFKIVTRDRRRVRRTRAVDEKRSVRPRAFSFLRNFSHFPSHDYGDAWNSPAMVTPRRQEIIKRYPEWRKNYRRISRCLRGVVDGKEEKGEAKERAISITVRHTSPRVAGARPNWRSLLGNNALLRNIVAQ